MALVANLLFIMFDYCVIGIVCTRPAWKHCQQPIRDGLLVSLEMYCNLKRRLRTCLEKKHGPQRAEFVRSVNVPPLSNFKAIKPNEKEEEPSLEQADERLFFVQLGLQVGQVAGRAGTRVASGGQRRRRRVQVGGAGQLSFIRSLTKKNIPFICETQQKLAVNVS